MKSNFFFANSAVSSIFLTPVSKLISLREELVNKLDMIDVVCVLSSRDPEADSRLYDTLLLTRDLVGYIEQEINRRYLETVFAQKLEQCAAQGRKAAVALVSIDNGQKLRDTYGQPVMDQLHCFVGNQWKKSFDTPATRVVCRLTGSIFAVGCLDADGKQLAEEMQNLYRQMPRECITTTGMMRRVPFTLSCGAAGLEDVSAKNWQALYELCDARLREAQNAGGDQMRAE